MVTQITLLGRAAIYTQGERLEPQNLLLVMDNLKHLLEGVSLVTNLLQAAPRLKILATSRECLGLHASGFATWQECGFPTWVVPKRTPILSKPTRSNCSSKRPKRLEPTLP